jgi:hypothetical protein
MLESILSGERLDVELRLGGTRGGGKLCHQAQACQERERQKQYFHGWYDLGGVMYAPILAVRQSRYKTRFIWNKINAVTYDVMIAFIPRDGAKLTETQIKALLAYLTLVSPNYT